jgi:hypothetical protein
MNVTEILIGVALLIAAVFAIRLAVPGRDGQVRGWLRGDTRQIAYTIFVLVLGLYGVSQIVVGAVP